MNRPSLIHMPLAPEELNGKVGGGIGLVAPFDFALDDECARWLPDNVPMFVTRTPELDDKEVTVNLAREVSSEVAVAPAVKSLLAVQPAAVGYACTSGSFVEGIDGENRLVNIMQNAGAPEAATTSGALLAALQALGARSVAIIAPYNHELSELLVDYLNEANIAVVSGGYLDMEHAIARVSQMAIKRLARQIDRPDAEAIFFSCTNLHTFDIIEELEAELNKPVLSANQVTIWATLKAGGLPQPQLPQRLFSL